MSSRQLLEAFLIAAAFINVSPAWSDDQEVSGPRETPADMCVKDRPHRTAIDLQGKDYNGYIIIGRDTIERYKKDCLPPKQQPDAEGLFSRFSKPVDVRVSRTEVAPYTYEPPAVPRRR